MIILKATKNQGSTLSLEDTFFEKTQRKGFKLNSPLQAILRLSIQESGK